MTLKMQNASVFYANVTICASYDISILICKSARDCQLYPEADTKKSEWIECDTVNPQEKMAVSGELQWRQTSAVEGGMSLSMSEGKGPDPLN